MSQTLTRQILAQTFEYSARDCAYAGIYPQLGDEALPVKPFTADNVAKAIATAMAGLAILSGTSMKVRRVVAIKVTSLLRDENHVQSSDSSRNLGSAHSRPRLLNA